MFFELAEEQKDLQTSVRAFLASRGGVEAVRAQIDADQGYDRAMWARMASELGLQSIAIDEEHGGAGASLMELVVVMEELGRVLYSGPYFSTVVLAATAIKESGDAVQQKRFLSDIAAGELTAALGLIEGDTFDLSEVGTVAERVGDRWSITGSKDLVIDGATADLLLIPATTSGGLSLFAVDPQAAGLTREPRTGLDQTRALADITLAGVEGTLVGEQDTAEAFLRRTLSFAYVALAAEQVGGAAATQEMAVDYAKLREQFGRIIGSFQAIKHKCADLAVKVETSRTLVHQAAWTASVGGDDAPLLADLAAAYVSDSYFHVVGQNIQIHGGIGYTWEHDAHLFFKRARSTMLLLGSPGLHRESAAVRLGLTPSVRAS